MSRPVKIDHNAVASFYLGNKNLTISEVSRIFKISNPWACHILNKYGLTDELTPYTGLKKGYKLRKIVCGKKETIYGITIPSVIVRKHNMENKIFNFRSDKGDVIIYSI